MVRLKHIQKYTLSEWFFSTYFALNEDNCTETRQGSWAAAGQDSRCLEHSMRVIGEKKKRKN